MKKVFSSILLITLLCGNIFGQDNKSNFKSLTAKSVYDELVNAFGDGRTPPEFKFIPNNLMKDSIVAVFIPGDAPVIELEELAYDVCRSFGKDSLNALACVLGHELAHYYLKHDWCSDFSKRLSHISIAPELNRIDKQEQLKNETEADYTGFYFGTVAGFRTFDLAPTLLRKLYTAYKLNPNQKGYPTMDQRIDAARQSKVMVLRRLPVFEAGTCLYQIGEYEMAYDCFNNLLSDFTSRENYNNAAVCKIQLALNLFQPYEMPFCFPFELDYDSRIASSSNRSGIATENEEKRRSYLMEAIKLLEESKRKDPGYSKAKINLAICYIMLDNTDMASGILKEIEFDTTIDRKVLRAICAARKNDFTSALNDLSEIIGDSAQFDLIANNRTLFKLALEKKLKIGDDELGYQLEKIRDQRPVTSIESDIPGNKSIFACLDGESKAIKASEDSIRVSSHNEILILKGNENYDRGLLIKNKLMNRSVLLCFISGSNSCTNTKSANAIFFSGNTNKMITTRGLTHKIIFAKDE
jgi:tetratricopeptide (TPR) repeat protein